MEDSDDWMKENIRMSYSKESQIIKQVHTTKITRDLI